MIFVGTKGKIEARIIPSLGYEFYTIWISGFKRTISIQNLLFPIKTIVSLVQSFHILRHVRPDAVIGTGGYVCGPVLFAASKKKIPAMVQEQNSYPGFTTRMLASRVDQVHLTFEKSKQYLRNPKQIFVSGTPVRSSLKRMDREIACRQFGLAPEKATIFVFGGSLGAAAINGAVMQLIRQLVERDVQVIWQTGKNDYEKIASQSRAWGSHVKVRSFIDEMGAAYSASDLVVCRAGATSLAELTLLGVPSILIPYPFAAANHQFENAKSMQENGAAFLLPETQLPTLGERLFSLLNDRSGLESMAARSKALGKPDAAIAIAQEVIHLIHRKRGEAAS